MHVRTRTWLSFVVLASALFLLGSRFAVFDPLEGAVQATAQPIESGLRDATRPVADFVNNLTDINRLTNDNRGLREENERLVTELSRLREADRDLQQLEQLINLRGVREGESFTAADVVASEPNNLQDVIAINRGESDGIAEDMIVLTEQGSLVGTVLRVLEHTAWVTVITDQTSAVSAMVQESRVQGVVVGSADGTLTMEFVEETADVKAGDFILTSGVGGRHPAGELIGQVVQVERTAQELFQEVQVQPLADLARLERVIVLDSFLPQEPGAP
ncbi:MAG: rod shape-determining protein MreC [Dehalococcoidia bacterium]